jgi:hypothetical protein
MRTVRKKTWPEYFEKVLSGEKGFEVRLADFELSKGDVLVLEEYDPKTKKYTGRKIERVCKNVMKINPFSFPHSVEDIKKHGFYVIGI